MKNHGEEVVKYVNFHYVCIMKKERTVTAYKNYFLDFINSLQEVEAKKVFYVIDILKTQERVNTKFVKYLRNELYETSIQIITPKEHDYCEFHTP